MPVEVGNLRVRSGDLLHGDRHGVINVPVSIAKKIPAAAARVFKLERRGLEVADAPNPSLQQLRDAVQKSVQER
ncbi:MAG: hypothetical protein ABSF14_16275 [Terriglobia bacterium]